MKFPLELVGSTSFGEIVYSSPLSVGVTIEIDDLDKLEAEPGHPHPLSGTVRAPRIGAEPLVIEEGAFQLAKPDTFEGEGWHLLFAMSLRSAEERRFQFDCRKAVRSGSLLADRRNILKLHTTLHEVHPSGRRAGIVGRGVVNVSVADLIRGLRALDVGGVGLREQLHRKWRVARTVGGALLRGPRR